MLHQFITVFLFLPQVFVWLARRKLLFLCATSLYLKISQECARHIPRRQGCLCSWFLVNLLNSCYIKHFLNCFTNFKSGTWFTQEVATIPRLENKPTYLHVNFIMVILPNGYLIWILPTGSFCNTADVNIFYYWYNFSLLFCCTKVLPFLSLVKITWF